jgi:UDP-N-acetylmuramyl pentapeptide phosphotransferase/UDP-N-acetylglucosamine-1-phosphate transferase
MLGERSVQMGDTGSAEAGTVLGWVVYLRSGVVGSVDQRP